jgi:tetratricopeptide (TPR) repeat protein
MLDLVRSPSVIASLAGELIIGIMRCLKVWILALATLALHSLPCAVAAEFAEGEKLMRAGRYDECAKLAAAELAGGAFDERWWHLKIKVEMARGKYDDAAQTLAQGQKDYPTSVSLEFLGWRLHRISGQDKAAAQSMARLEAMILEAPQRYMAAESRLTVGRFLLLRGAPARRVLDSYFNEIIRQNPKFLSAHFAVAELAIDKQDFALAADTLVKAPKDASEDPYFHYLLARAYSYGDREASTKALEEALKLNPKHADSLLLRAEQLISSEKYADAERVLGQVIDVDPLEPRAWAFRAAIAHFKSDHDGEAAARKTALSRWPRNPDVDHLIGKKLSEHYRMAEGAAYQRRALEMDAAYAPAQVQLCQDLLRLGQEEEGWKRANEIFTKDEYNIVAFNLVTLRDSLAKFKTIQRDGFVLRMDKREAALYGERAMDLLIRARKTLAAKYGVEFDRDIIVEIFPKKQDFGVRTFGLPWAEGFLGVCFGPVITATSPATQGEHPSNWEAVLWHEFCHTVTLTKTKNKMPRWLSEGISVYEEEQENPSWGQWMQPRFREMILADKGTPLGELSSAFLNAKSSIDLQFAYYQSGLAVAYFVERHGLEALKAALTDMGAGVDVNDALARHAGVAVEGLNRQFGDYTRKHAARLAPDATWEDPDVPVNASSDKLAEWVNQHPKNLWGLQRLSSQLVREEKWPLAEETATKFKDLFPEYLGSESAYELLSVIYQKTANVAKERAILEEWATRDSAAGAAYMRLAELAEKAGDWRTVVKNARRQLAVNPLIPAPHRALARAAEELGERPEAIAAYRALLLLGEPDEANIHYRLASLLAQSGERDQARREVLKALEIAPRFLEAHRLLLELVAKQ